MTSFASPRKITNADMAQEYISALMEAYVPSTYPDAKFRAILGPPDDRAKAKGYSSCGDLLHFAMWSMGVRDKRIVNRNPWVSAVNISKLYQGGQALGVWEKYKGQVLMPGTGFFVGGFASKTFEHVGIFHRHSSASPAEWETWEAGQVDTGWQASRAYPWTDVGGARHVRQVKQAGSTWSFGSPGGQYRPINGIWRLYDLPVEADCLPVDNGRSIVGPIIGVGVVAGIGYMIADWLFGRKA